MDIDSLDEIFVATRPSDQVGESKSTEANAKWKDQLQYFQQSNSHRESFGIDGQPIELVWNIFPGLTTLEILQKIQEHVADRQISPEHFEGRIIFTSMFNDVDWTQTDNSKGCLSNFEKVKKLRKKVSAWTLFIPRPRR